LLICHEKLFPMKKVNSIKKIGYLNPAWSFDDLNYAVGRNEFRNYKTWIKK